MTEGRATDGGGPLVLSIVQDPKNGGGVATVNTWYRRWMERNRPGENFELFLDEGGAPFDFTRELSQRHDLAHRIPRLLPRLHVPQYLGGRALVARHARGAREAHVMGGVAVHGHLATGLCPMLVWIGTTIGSERRAVIPSLDSRRRALHRTTLPFLERFETRALRSSRRVLAQSPMTADDVLALGVPASAIEVVPVPVDTETFRPDEAERRGILFVGRADDPRKNFGASLDLLESSSIARDEGLDVISRGRPRSRAVALGEAVRWHGRVDDVAERHRRAKLLILTSLQEGLGIVVLEALASGTPVVALASGGPDRYIKESTAGVVAQSVPELRRHVEALLADDGALREMGARGRAWVIENASGSSFLDNPSIFRLGG